MSDQDTRKRAWDVLCGTSLNRRVGYGGIEQVRLMFSNCARKGTNVYKWSKYTAATKVRCSVREQRSEGARRSAHKDLLQHVFYGVHWAGDTPELG